MSQGTFFSNNTNFEIIYKSIKYIKETVLDSAGLAGVFLAILFWQSDKPLDFMNNYFVLIYILVGITVLITSRLRYCCSNLKGMYWGVLDFIMQIIAAIFMWVIVVDGVLNFSENAVTEKKTESTLSSQKKLLKAYSMNSENKILSFQMDIVELNKKIEELQSTQSELLKQATYLSEKTDI
jgi:hypothetical protein